MRNGSSACSRWAHSETQIARIHAPIGLNIGAATPAEIAVAVLGQVIEAFRSRGLAAKSQAAA